MFKLVAVYLLIINCAKTEDVIRGRAILFRNTETSTVLKSKVVTSLVPSSCVQVAPSLLPCRNVRFLRFPKLPTISFNNPANEEVVSNWRSEPSVETTPLGWGEYFGFYDPTVTITRTNLHITTVQDPSVVVTFAVKGCRPLKLPMDLDRCPPEFMSSLVIEEVLPTSTVAKPVVATETLLPTKTLSGVNPTVTLEAADEVSQEQQLEETSNLLEPSKEERVDSVSTQPTQAL